MKTASARKLVHPRAQFGNRTRTCSIAAVGSYVPARILTNAELTRLVNTSDEWITTRTGIKERRLAAVGEYTSEMAAKAARLAMDRGNVSADEIDLIIVASISPDMPFPATACFVQEKLGARRSAAFDIQAACSGFIYALEIAQQFITSHTYNTVLVIGAEKLSAIVDWQDRNTCVLFGDGAGAAILRNRPGAHGLITTVMGTDGSKAGLLHMPGGGSRCPASAESLASRQHFLHMDGRETFKYAINAMVTAGQEVLKRCQIDISQVKCVIPHQANRRIVDAVGERLGVRPEQVFVNLDKYGNTSAASVAIALDEAVETGRIERGDLVLLVVFGAGLTWASALIEW